jgi:hypothetical protein
LLGEQKPRIEHVPAGIVHPDLEAALELVAAAGLRLDPWQEHVFRNALLRANGKWAAFQVGLVCPRQNGKNAILEARELAGLFIFGERLIVHSAHLADTAMEAFKRFDELIAGSSWLSKEVKRVARTNGREAIELRSGQRIKFKTRTASGGRGLSGDCVVFDECMDFPEPAHASILPILSARPNPQAWYTGSAVDQTTQVNGRVLTSLRERGMEGDAEALAYFEWSTDLDNPSKLTLDDALDVRRLAIANPALGIRISEDYLRREAYAYEHDLRSLAVERHGNGDWPRLTGDAGLIDLELWDSLEDDRSRMVDPVCFAFDVTPDRTHASVAAAGLRADGKPHVELVKHASGTGWLVDEILELKAKHRPAGIACDARGPAGSLLPAFAEKRFEPHILTSTEHAAGCGMFYDATMQGRLRHLSDPKLRSAVAGAIQRPLGDAWAWNRRGSHVDISPLVAVTLALYELSLNANNRKAPMVGFA